MQGETTDSESLRQAMASYGLRTNPTYTCHFIVGMTNSAPSFTPHGQREVTVLVLV